MPDAADRAAKGETKTETKQEAVTEQASGQSTEETGITFPLEEQVTLTMWAPFNVNAASVMEDYNGSLVFQEMEKRTNVHIEFIHPAIGQDSEQFNLMIASQEYPDMIMGGISNYVGGGDLAVEDGVFLQLNDLIDQYAPNYKAILESNPEAQETGVLGQRDYVVHIADDASGKSVLVWSSDPKGLAGRDRVGYSGNVGRVGGSADGNEEKPSGFHTAYFSSVRSLCRKLIQRKRI